MQRLSSYLSSFILSPICQRIARLLLLGIFLLCTSCLHPALGQYRFDSWTTDNGLPQNSVRSIVQTPDGYLWFTTFDGLVRFDGVRFTVFDKSNTKGLASNRFIALYADKDGTLYAGTEDNGLTIYRNGRFTSYTPTDGFPGRGVFEFKTDLNGELLIDAGDKHLYLRDGKFILAPSEYESPVKSFYLSPSGAQWTIDTTGARQVKNGRVTHYPIKFNFMEKVRLYEDGKGNTWFADRLRVFRLKDGSITHFTADDGVPTGVSLHPYCEDDDGGVWFSTRRIHAKVGAGLVRFKDGRFTAYGTETGLTDTDTGYVFKDREGTIWVATSRGLNRLRKELITAYSTGSGLVHREVYPILQTHNGDIFIGTTQGLSVFRNGKFTELPFRDSNGNPFWVQALGEDSMGRLWIGILGGLHWYENGKQKDVSEMVNRRAVWTISTDRNGNVWVGTEIGLFKFTGDKRVAHYTTKDGLPSDDVKVVHEDRNGTLWFGTYGGLVQLKDGKFINYTSADGLAGNRIRSIYEDGDGTLWIGTYDDGLSRFRRDGRFFNYKTEHGLFNNGVFCILEDERDNFWISCNRGIYRVSRQELNDFAHGKITKINSVAYGKQDGMLNTECNGGRQPAGIKDTDGKLWFPTQEGVVVLDPDSVEFNPTPPPVLIEFASVDRADVDFTNGIQINPGQANLEINYTGLSFIKPEQIHFKYKLEGQDADWVDAGTRRVAYYSYLQPGEYMFRVIAANSDSVWNIRGASVRVTVHPPFYKTWWFRILFALFIAGLAASVYILRIRRLKQANAAQAAFTARLIESQEAERKRIASELHDSLGQNLLIVKNWALMGLNALPSDNTAREHLSEISETTSLALDEVRHIAHNLRPYQLERLGLTNTLEYMIRQVKNTSDIEFITEIDDIDGMLSKEAEINFYRIVQECINNVLKHSEAAEAWLSIKRAGNGVRITCRDNGKGFNPEIMANSNRGGLGLTGIADRVRMLGGTYMIQSAPGEGAQISINISAADGRG